MNRYLAIYGKPRYLGIIRVDGEKTLEKGSTVTVESVRGEEYATVVGGINEEQEREYRLLRNAADHGDSMVKGAEPIVTDLKFIAPATPEDCEKIKRFRSEEVEILRIANEVLDEHDLDMKLIDVEYLIERKKLFIYFAADQRVDFRSYVRDLAREFRTRIELRQIGVRDEAKIIRGVGPCGRPCCCSYWLNQFSPICIRMVKEQNLALNPSKISGLCGRLMCCMCFEHEAYKCAWEGFPPSGTKIKTPTGNVVVSGVDLPSSCVRCFIPGRGEVKVSRETFAEFKDVVSSGGEWVVPEEKIGYEPLLEDELIEGGGIAAEESVAFDALKESEATAAAGDGAKSSGAKARGRRAKNEKATESGKAKTDETRFDGERSAARSESAGKAPRADEKAENDKSRSRKREKRRPLRREYGGADFEGEEAEEILSRAPVREQHGNRAPRQERPRGERRRNSYRGRRRAQGKDADFSSAGD